MISATLSVALSAGQQTLTGWLFFGHTDNIAFHVISRIVMEIFAVIASILMFFLVYWILPHRKIPASAVLEPPSSARVKSEAPFTLTLRKAASSQEISTR